jgi:solute carrier family 35 protein F1/2
MLILYTVAPLLYRLASSAYFNLSLLSSDFYGLLFGKSLYIFLLSPWLTGVVVGLFLFVSREDSLRRWTFF